MSETPAPAPDRPTPEFDIERLSRAKYLNGPEAAFYLGYTRERYKNPIKAFHELVKRNHIPHGYVGRRLLFYRTDLDKLVNRTRDAMVAAAQA